MLKVHAELLDGYARFRFEENLKAGNGEQNAVLTEVQKALLNTLQEHVAREADYATAALEQLGKHLEPWIAHGHWTVAD